MDPKDFLLIQKSRDTIRTLNFELKKSNDNRLLWNDGFPQENSVYLFSSTSGYNVLFSKNIVPEEVRKMFLA